MQIYTLCTHTCTCRLERAQNFEEDIQGVTSGKEDFISQFLAFGTISDHLLYLCTLVSQVWSQGRGSSHMPRKEEALRFGVLCLLMHNLQDHFTGGGAALGGGVHTDGLLRRPCVLFPVHVYPEDQAQGWSGSCLQGDGVFFRLPHLSSPRGTGQGRSGSELGSAEEGRGTHEQPAAPDPVLIRRWWLEGWPLP